MSVKLHLGVRTSPGSYKRVTLNDVNPATKVIDLKVEAGKVTSLPMESLELSYCGNLLDDEQTVLECNLQSGVTVHVLKKHVPNDYSKKVERMSEAQIKQLAATFTLIFQEPVYRNALHELMKNPKQIENLLLKTPALKDDPVAVAILQDPILMERLADVATFKRIAQHHPALAETANYIAKAVEEEGTKPSGDGSAPPPAFNDVSSYFGAMDDFTDDEEMDSSQSSDSIAIPTHGLRGQITSSQLAAALASATGGFAPFMSPFSGPSQASTSSGQSSGSGSVITPDMLQSALASFSPSSSSPMMPPPPVPPPPQVHLNSMGMTQAQQIQQMHEVGLRDDVVNMHALSITEGDVQAAINLVLSGVITGGILED